MERLTSRQVIKHADGTEHIETYCHGHRYGPAAFPNKYGTSDSDEYKNYCEMVDRIAEYEDTGLEPSEIASIQEAYDLSREEVQGLSREPAEYQRLEKEGLLIKYPCKIGDAVYWINNYHNDCEPKKINEVTVQCYTWWLTHGFCVKIANMFENIPCLDKPISEFGKTIFLTQAEAEEALKGSASE